MSDFKKRVNSYRVGDNWKDNFKHINYTNVSASIKSILTKHELNKQYDRLGNHKGTNGKLELLTLDEKVFRLCVLMDSQMAEQISRARTEGIADGIVIATGGKGE